MYLLAYEDGTECSEMSAYRIQMPGNYPEKAYNNSHIIYLVQPCVSCPECDRPGAV